MKNFGRRDHLRCLENELQKEWKNSKLFEIKADLNWNKNYSSNEIEKSVFEEKNKKKHFTTFPYPYMNGRLHLGHAFSLSKCEFSSRYQRLIGKNSLFPFAFHTTGMPIAAASNRVKSELAKNNNNIEEILKQENSQINILKKMGIEKDILSKFADPVFWLEYFPPYGRKDLETLGVSCDFSRSFITTNRQPYYDKFVTWQFNRLKKQGVIKFGKRYTVYSRSDDQPCADHDRSEGEGVGVQEYTTIKLKIIGGKVSDKLKELLDKKDVYMVAGTLRPETMYGQTNIFVLPTGDYGVYELKDKNLIICSHFAAECLSYQEQLSTIKKTDCLLNLKGTDLIGLKVHAPLSFYKEIYAIPLLTISMTKGTGIVTSVPSDSPDDYMALSDFKNDEKLRKKHNVELEYVKDYEPVKIVNIPEISDLSAVDMCKKLKIKNHMDKDNLKKAKDEVYKYGFYSGVMLVGDYKGEKIEAAKKKVKNDLIKSGDAFIYCEPESTVKTREGELAIVALVDQWMISYGEEEYRKFVEEHVTSNKFNAFNKNTLKEIHNKVNWLKEWGCSRIFGLGSRLPWDTYYLIESLSDSTIYMAYYTICKYFHSDINGDKTSLLSVEQVNDSLFDYVFLGKDSEELKKLIKDKDIDRKIVEDMRNEFTYWYPMDLRCSGKDLIPNHLTMSLYNHAFIWDKDTNYMPKGIFTNGYMQINNKPMSKKTGNFKTLFDSVEEYGADATRLTLADGGDGNDDANFITEVANSNINRLFSFENFVKALIKDGKWEDKCSSEVFLDVDNLKLQNKFDIIFENNINYLIELSKSSYDSMKYKDVLKYGFFEMINIKDQYVLYFEDDLSKLNPTLMLRYFKVFFTVMNPIIPHWTEYMYRTYLNKYFEINSKSSVIKNLAFSSFPTISKDIDASMFSYNRYLKGVISSIHELVNSKQTDKKKHNKNKDEKKIEQDKSIANTKESQNVNIETKKDKVLFDKEIHIYYLPKLSEDQLLVLTILNKSEFDDSNKLLSDFKPELREKISDNKRQISAFQFGSYIAKEVEKYGKEAMQIDLGFTENDILEENLELIKNLTKTKLIKILPFDDKTKPKGVKQAPIPGKPIYYCV